MTRWLLGLSGLLLLAMLVGVIVFWPYVMLAGMWWGITRRYRRLGRRLER